MADQSGSNSPKSIANPNKKFSYPEYNQLQIPANFFYQQTWEQPSIQIPLAPPPFCQQQQPEVGHNPMQTPLFNDSERWSNQQPSHLFEDFDRAKAKEMDQGRCREEIIQKVKESTEQAVSKHFEESLRLAKEKQMKKLKQNTISPSIDTNTSNPSSYGRLYGPNLATTQISQVNPSSMYKSTDYEHVDRGINRSKLAPGLPAVPPLLQQQYSESVIVQNLNFPKKSKLNVSTSYNHSYLEETHFLAGHDANMDDARIDSTRFQSDKPAVLLPNTQACYRPLDRNGQVSFINGSPESKGIPNPTSSSTNLLPHHTMPSQVNFPPPPAHVSYKAPQISKMQTTDCSPIVDCLHKESLSQPIFSFLQDLSFQTQPLDLGVASNRKIESTDISTSHESLTIFPNETITIPATDNFEENSNIEMNDGIQSISSRTSHNKVLGNTKKSESYEEKIDVKETDAILKAPRHLKKAWLQRHTGEDVDTSDNVNSLQEIKTATLSYNDNSSKLNIESDAPTQDEVKTESEKSTETKENLSNVQDLIDDSNKQQPNEKILEISDIDNASSKDSDKNSSSTYSESNAESSLKEKTSKDSLKRERLSNGQSTEKKKKKSDGGNSSSRSPFARPPIMRLKKTGESFLQDGPCWEVCPKLSKCRECRWTANQRSKNTSNIFCRFYAFRKLRYTKGGLLAIAGFSDPHKDPKVNDLKLWTTDADHPQTKLDLQMSRFILAQVADQFCDLLTQEKGAIEVHLSEDNTIAWKRVVQGVREMCDVCQTTLFNNHFSCPKCGFVVCLDCYKARKNHDLKIWTEVDKDRDEYAWLFCNNKSAHEQDNLMLTQIIAGDSLQILGQKIHEVRTLWEIPQHCECTFTIEKFKPINEKQSEIIKDLLQSQPNCLFRDKKPSVQDSCIDSDSDSDKSTNEETEKTSALRDLLTFDDNVLKDSTTSTKKNSSSDTEKNIISHATEEDFVKSSVELRHYISKTKRNVTFLPTRIMTLAHSRTLYPVPHQWLCDGKLLRLLDPAHPSNYKIFQEQWKRGQPVIVSSVTKRLKSDLWHPNAFSREFGEEKFDLINCISGTLLPNQPLKKFWDGFDNISMRLKDDKGNPMLLKLKDWPPGEDFSEVLPSRFNDFMQALPLGEYTQRTGRLNLASRFPPFFVRPDLGPKMYCAYGSALHETKGTTNLHLDISDAVNVMVYVGIPQDIDYEENIKEAFRAIDDADCDILTRRRVREKCELPGALWHIYSPKDADKIRDLLNKVAIERGVRLQPHHDPIHDQSWYLDKILRARLYAEYGVEGYPIAQCLGDAVFIPAGAPHQVRNLHNCIKIAEDFVSPENISHCFHLTQEFRNLSDTHTNHEDKLQIKNIIYHAVKDAVSCLSYLFKQKTTGSADQFQHILSISEQTKAE